MANSTSHSALPYCIRNARYSVPVTFRVSAGTLTDPTTPDTELSSDGGASFADTTEEITTGGSNGCGYVTLTGAETNNNLVILACKSANDLTTPVVLVPRVLAIVGSGTLSAGSAGGGTLGTVLAYDVCGCFIRTTGGTGGGGTGGANNQARKIVTYTTSTGAFTVTPNWDTTPDATTTYDVLLPEGVTLGMLKALNPTTAGRTLDVSTGGEAGLDWANVGSPTTSNALTGTTIATTQKVDVETIKTRAVTAAGAVVVGGFVGQDTAAIGVNASGHVSRVTLVDTTTTNTDMRGTDNAALAATALSTVTWTGTLATNLGTLASHDPGATLGTSTLTQTQVTGGAYALNSASFAFNAALDFTTTQKAATIARVTLTDTLTTYTNNTPQTGDVYALANGASGFAAIKTDTGNLVTRITSTLFSGITSLAQWLGLIAGKQVGNTTARTELNATGAGSGGYDETTDSQEAIRDRGDSAWITATSVAVSDKTGFSLTSAYDFAKGTVAVTESYNADGAAPTPVQALMVVMQMLTEMSIAGTTTTVKKLDGSTTAFSLTLNDATTPTSVTRAT